MRLHDLVEAYIDYKHSLGMRYRSQAAGLRAYCRAMGDVAVEEVRPECVLAFITGTGPVTARWMDYYRILGGFYRYAIGRDFAATSPLPTDIPKFPPPLIPYIYSVDELKRLLAATDTLQTPRSPLLALTMRRLLLLLYGTGMRVGEALALTLQDVDLEERLGSRVQWWSHFRRPLWVSSDSLDSTASTGSPKGPSRLTSMRSSST